MLNRAKELFVAPRRFVCLRYLRIMKIGFRWGCPALLPALILLAGPCRLIPGHQTIIFQQSSDAVPSLTQVNACSFPLSVAVWSLLTLKK